MGCPQCRSEEIDPSGICLVCGYQIHPIARGQEPESSEEEGSGFSGMIAMEYSGNAQEPPSEEELPQWRKELSQRLLAIKQKRGSSGVPGEQIESTVPSPPAPQAQTAEPPDFSPTRIADTSPVRKSAPKPRQPVPRQKMLQPLEPESTVEKPVSTTPAPHEIQKIIDNIVSRKSAQASVPESPDEIPGFAEEEFADDEGKLILISRVLSGLVDLIFVVLCTGGCIIAADFFSGIIVLDSITLLIFSMLFLLTYFVYSLFFLALGASSQTVGMMITDLHVVGADEERPSMRHLLIRCSWYLVSLFGLGIGLLWSLFNRESLCFHDRYSNTRVIRI